MHKIFLIESSIRDAGRFKALLARDEVEIVECDTASLAEQTIVPEAQSNFAAVFIRWEISEPQFGFRLLLRCHKLWPEVPAVIMSATLDAEMVTRAFKMGARDFLEKPLEVERLRSCVQALLAKPLGLSAIAQVIQRSIRGESPSLLATFEQIAKVIPRDDMSVLLVGEPGTGKELFADAIHKIGDRASKPLVAVNVGAVPGPLIESLLFGYEKGAFTGANERKSGFFEQAGDGILFLDEIGELDLALQVKLLRVLQERSFWRIGGNSPLPFKARVVFATNRDLAEAVNRGLFRRDLFDRITELQIQVPPLRDRKGDIELLLAHFLGEYGKSRQLIWARETLSILRSYPFPGNVRELQNVVKGAVVECEGSTILPRHLPLDRMGAFVGAGADFAESVIEDATETGRAPGLIAELGRMLPANWLDLPYREALQPYERAFDRVYFTSLLGRHHHNITRAATVAGIDVKTFRKRWKECGLPPLNAGETADE